MSDSIPVILFAYARPQHLERTLESLRVNRVPLIYAYSDGPRTSEKVSAVTEVRQILTNIDWCKVVLTARPKNMGLGKSILAGVSEVLLKHEMAIVFEDDLVCAPGTYDYLCAALYHYRDVPKVMSVTGWTHPRVTPTDVYENPYFDGRAECWVWGIWSRAWSGMDRPAIEIMRKAEAIGIDRHQYGADLVQMAETETQRNIWAVRLLYLHILNRGLCLRPPWSLVQHIGFDEQATNAADEAGWGGSCGRCPPIPTDWPPPIENAECQRLWYTAHGSPLPKKKLLRRVASYARHLFRSALRF